MLDQQRFSKHPNKQLNYFQEILASQQLQQMSGDQRGLDIFYKLKDVIFEQSLQEQQIISQIRQQPIKVLGSIIYILTKSYHQKLIQIVGPIEQQKDLLLQKLRQTNERLQYYIDDNDFLRCSIDRLQEEKKETELKLNQSIEQFEQSREEIMEQIKERQKIKGFVLRISTDVQEIFAQNSQLKQTNFQYQRQMVRLQTENLRLSAMSQQMMEKNKQMTAKYNQAMNKSDQTALKADQLQNQLHQRQTFIKQLMEQYNKAHFFKQYESSGQYKRQQTNNDESQFNELQGFNFNNFDKNSNISQKSLSKNSSVCRLENDIDQKFQCINATAQKIKPKIPMSHIYVTDQKPYKKSDNKPSSKQKNKFHKQAHPNNKIETVKLSSSKINKTMVKTVSSKNLKQKQSIIVTPSENEGSKMMQDLLKKKIGEKNQKIQKLQYQVKYLKEGFIQQRQKITIMQGEYQLQIEELRDQLNFTKNQLSRLYSQYTASNAQRTVYLQRAQQLEEKLTEMDQYYKAHCQQLKRRCKSYVLTRIDQIQRHYETLKSSIKKESASKSRNKTPQEANESEYKLQYSLQSQGVCEQFQLKLNQDNGENCNIDSFSQVQGYERLQGHYFNGFQLQFSSKLSNMDHNREQIFVQEQFQIEPNLGAFTQRFINQHKEHTINKGNFTERCIASSIQLEKPPLKLSICQNGLKKKLQLFSLIITYVINPAIKKLQIHQTESNNWIFHSKKNLDIQGNIWNYKHLFKRVMNLQSHTNQYTFLPNNKQLKIEFKTSEHIFIPIAKEYTFESLINYRFIPQQKKMLFISKVCQIKSQPQKKQPLTIKQAYQLTITKYKKYHDNQTQTNIVESKETVCQTEQRCESHAECQTAKDQRESHSQTQQRCESHAECQTAKDQRESHSQTEQRCESYAECQTAKDQRESHSQTEQRCESHAECQTITKKLSFFNISPLTSTLLPLLQQASIQQPLQQLQPILIEDGKQNQYIQQMPLQPAQIINQEQKNSIQEKPIQILNENVVDKNEQAAPNKQALNSCQQQFQHQKESLTSYCISSDTQQIGNNSALNNAICYSQSNSKEPKTFNPQTKSYNVQRQNNTQVNISPWFDQKKEQRLQIPQQITSVLTKTQLYNLYDFLQWKDLNLFFESKTQSQNFQKPKQIKRKFHFLFINRNGKQQVFCISEYRLHNLTNNQYLTLTTYRYLDKYNFIFGNSEVYISRGCLIIHRKRSRYTLQGNIEDAVLKIQYYLTCYSD